MVTTKIHKFIIDSGSERLFESINIHEENHVTGRPIIHFQDQLHLESQVGWNRIRPREESDLRDNICRR